MARKPNYEFERRERDRLKAIKVAEKAQAKKEARERAKLENAGTADEADAAERCGEDLTPRCEDVCVKIEPRQVDAFLKKPDPKIRGVVIYGNDDGLVAERAVALAKTVCEDLKDPVPRGRYRGRRR